MCYVIIFFMNALTILFASVSMAFQFKQEEINAIMNDFTEPGTLAPTGLYLGGTKYMVIQGEPGAVIRGKKVITGHLFLLLTRQHLNTNLLQKSNLQIT